MSVLAWLVTRAAIGVAATQKANALMDVADIPSDTASSELAFERLTKQIHLATIQSRSSQPTPLLMKFRPYLTHRLLPAALRLPEGAIELIYLRGNCDSIARSLIFLLRNAGVAATQINFVTPAAAHSAVLARLEGGRKVLLDPFFGIVAKHDGRLVGPAEARSLIRQGARGERVWYSLDSSSDASFYEQFANANFAQQGQRLEILAEVPVASGEAFQLGEENGRSDDVSRDAAAAGFTPYWHYLGSRYDRAWIRKLYFRDSKRVVVGVVETPDPRFITSQQSPEIQGRTLVYHLKAGETLAFEDARAEYDWFRLRSYQDVDYIRFSPE